MNRGDVLCQRCGWRNDSSARMCGGCGRPLGDDDLTAPSAPSDPTLGWSQTVPLPGPATAAGALPPPPRAWPSRAAPSVRTPRRGNAWRGVLAAAVPTLLALAIAWAAIVRPAVHAQVDGQLRALLDAGVRQATAPLAAVPPDQRIPNLRITVAAADLTDEIRSQLPADSPLKNVAVSFTGGRMVIAYSLLNGQGVVSTNLSVAGGRLVAGDTRVDGALGLVEDAGELQAAFDEALAQVPDTVAVESVTADSDTMVLVVGQG